MVPSSQICYAWVRMQLFTGNTAFLPLAVIEGRASVRQLAVNWGASFIGNLAGALLAVSAIAGAGLVGNSGPAIPVALAKVQLPFSQARPVPRISLLPFVFMRSSFHTHHTLCMSRGGPAFAAELWQNHPGSERLRPQCECGIMEKGCCRPSEQAATRHN